MEGLVIALSALPAPLRALPEKVVCHNQQFTIRHIYQTMAPELETTHKPVFRKEVASLVFFL